MMSVGSKGGARLYQNSGALEAAVVLEDRGDLAHQALEGQLAQQQVGRLLKVADLADRHRARAVAVRLLGPFVGGLVFSAGFAGQLLLRRLATGGLAVGLFGTCHCFLRNNNKRNSAIK